MLLKERENLSFDFLQFLPPNFGFETSNVSLCHLQLLTG